MDTSSASRRVESVHTSFQILSIIQNQDGATLQEISTELDIAQSTTHNHLSTLKSLGYVTSTSNEYHLGLRFLTHGMAARERLPGKQTVISKVEEISGELSQPVWWIAEELGRGIFVDKVGSYNSTEYRYAMVGRRSYLHSHAPGKAILAEFSEDTLQSMIEKYGLPILTNQTTTDLDVLKAELKEIQEDGFASSEGEAALGIQSVGAAFHGPEGRLYALGVFGYSQDFHGQQIIGGIGTQLREAAQELENNFQ